MSLGTLTRGIAFTLLLALSRAASAQRVEWPQFAGDLAATKYSSLTDINRDNVARLTKAWEWATGETPNAATRARPGNFQATPLMIGDTLFLSTSYNRVIALDASTGRELWAFDPKMYLTGQPPNGTGFVHRGVATWTDGRHRRVFINSRWNLIAIDASTGQPGSRVRRYGLRRSHPRAHAQRQAGQQIPLHGDVAAGGVAGSRDRRQRRRRPARLSERSAGRRAGVRRANRPSASGASARFRARRRTSAPKRGRTNRGRRRATPTSGRRSASTTRADSSISP